MEVIVRQGYRHTPVSQMASGLVPVPRAMALALRERGVPDAEVWGAGPLISYPLAWEGETFDQVMLPFSQHPKVISGEDWIPLDKAREIEIALAYLGTVQAPVQAVVVLEEAPKGLAAYLKKHGTLPALPQRTLPSVQKEVAKKMLTGLRLGAALALTGIGVVAAVGLLASAMLASGDPAVFVTLGEDGFDQVTYLCIARWDHPIVAKLTA